MTKNKVIPIVNVLSFIIMIVINILAMINLIGYSTKEISDAIPTLLMPIGITFSIVWTVIYGFLAVYTVYQLFAKNKRDIEQIGIYYLMSNLLNILWIISFHIKMYLISTVIIVFLLVMLNRIVYLLQFSSKLPKITFSIYYGWITVATLVSIFSFMSSINPENYNSLFMRIATVVALIALLLVTMVRNRDYPYVLTVVVAMLGILFKHIIDYKQMYPEIIVVTMIALIMIVIVMMVNIMSSDNEYRMKRLLNHS